MRIAYLTGEYPRVTDTFIQREVAALRQHGKVDGATVHTFSVRKPKASDALSETQQQERDSTSYLLPVSPVELLIAQLTLLITQPARYFRAIALAWQTRQLGIRGTLYQLIYFLEAGLLAHRLKKQDITHLHNHFGDSSCTVAMIAAALGSFDYSFTLHGPGIFFEPFRWQLSEKIGRAKFVSCISYFCRSQTMIFAPWKSWPNLHIVHCGVDPDQFTRPEKPSTDSLSSSVHSVGSKGQRLLYVGRLAAAKGMPILLKSMATLKLICPEIHLTVVGDGEDRAELEKRAQALGLGDHIVFVGYQTPDAVREYLQASDIFVMSSFAEGVPVVLMEAMMSGLPVVATQIAGVSELVEDEVNGFLVPPSDVGSLTQKIQVLLDDESLRKRLGDRGQQKVSQEFNIHHEAKKLYQLIVSAPASEQPVLNSSEPDAIASHTAELASTKTAVSARS